MNTKNEKSRKKALLIGTGVALAALAFGGAALADKGHFRGGPGGHMPGAVVMRMMSQLDLNDQQELKAIHIRKNLQEQAMEQRKEMQGTLLKVADELEKPNPDATKLHGIADQVIARIQKLTHSAIDQMLELHATFTPQQRETLVEHLRGFEEHREHRGERGDREDRIEKKK